MAMRRPRIKPVANIQLNAKRKAKTVNDAKTVKNSESESKEPKDVEKQDDFHSVEESATPVLSQDTQSVETSKEVRKDSSDTPSIEDNLKSSKLDQQEENAGDETSYDNVAVVAEDNDNGEKLANEEPLNVKSSENIQNEAKLAETETVSDTNAFKCPPKVEFQRLDSHISNSGVDDVFYSDIEENALQMETEKPSSNGCPISPSKNLNRQRIKATPHFGQRRNSFIGTSPSPHTTTNEDCNKNNSINNNEFVQPSPTRRERHYSASFAGNNHSTALNHHHHHTTHKYLPSGIINNGMGRIRTESGCSVFSDTNNSTHKSRKHEDNKQNLRKEFEARFFNGVPEKSVIKMSDLIYYNPISNPMEQKPNPNVKQEQQAESSSNDVKPFDGKQEKESENKDIENEGVPVPQLKLNAKGELILDDKSLVIETTAEQEARKVLANSSLIYLDENTGMNGFYSRQKRTREWLPAETIKFYRCLQNVGTDFSLMVSLFPNRTRRDLKLKFKKEERKNGHLINKALLYPKQFNLEALKQQIEDEEKLREEQAKSTKEAKKRSKKRKLSTSAADRVLQSDAVYQNENVQKQKRVRKTVASEKNENRTATSAIETDLKEKCKNFENTVVDQKPQQTSEVYSDSCNTTIVDSENVQANEEDEIDINENNIESNIVVENKIPENNTENKPKRRRRRTPNKVAQKEITIIKEEIIKIENKQESNNPIERLECPDGTQLQTEMDELLNTDVADINFSNTSCGMEALNNTFDESQVPQPCDVVNTPLYSPYISQNGDNYYPVDMDIDKYEHRTIVNLDDGSVNVYSKMEDYNHYKTMQSPVQPSQPPVHPSEPPALPTPPPRSQTPIVETQPYMPPQAYTDNNPAFSSVPEPEMFNNETCSSVISERELNEEDIQTILTELADGSLVLVSSLDPDDPDKVLNEIYMVDKNTGELCEEPLNIPDNIVQCILSVVS